MKKTNLYLVLSILIAITLNLGSALLAIWLKSCKLEFTTDQNFMSSIILLITFILLIFATTSGVLYSHHKKHFLSMSEQEKHDYMLKQKEVIEQDCEIIEKSLYKSINLFNLYKIALIVLFNLFIFLISINLFVAWLSPFIILSFVSTTKIIFSFFPFSTDTDFIKRASINESQFPHLFSIIERAGKYADFNGKITVIHNGEGISITEENNLPVLVLSAETVALLNENELYSVLLHEFAHFKNQDTAKRKKLYAFITQNGGDGTGNNSNFTPSLFLKGFFARLQLKAISFDLFSTIQKEKQADLALKDCNKEQDFINATAKSTLFGLYSQYPWREIAFDVYETENPVHNYAQRNLNCFYKKVEEYGERWHVTLNRELQSRIDSHPTLKMRMQALGVENYTVDFTVKEGEYKQEQTKLLQAQSEFIVAENTRNDKTGDLYKQQHKLAYLDRVAVMQKYDNATEWDKLSDSELVECAQAFLFIDDKKAETILLDLTSRTNSSLAYYLLGCYYSREYNDECISYFKRGASDTSATLECYEEIGKYALKTGNQELLEEYRAVIVEKVQTVVDDSHEFLFTTNGLYAPTESDQEVVNELKEKLCEYWDNTLIALYIAVREVDSTTAYYLAIEVNFNKNPKAVQSAYDETCFLLNRLSGVGKKFNLYLAGKEFNQIKRLKNSCIYKNNDNKK